MKCYNPRQYTGKETEDCGSTPKNKDISSTFCLGDANRSKGEIHDTKEANTAKCDNELLDHWQKIQKFTEIRCVDQFLLCYFLMVKGVQ